MTSWRWTTCKDGGEAETSGVRICRNHVYFVRAVLSKESDKQLRQTLAY